MRAAVLVELNQPLEIAELGLPALSYGQVLVKVHFSGICGAQLNEMEGAKGPDKFLPHLMGHEGGAEVLECGPGVTRVKAGDHVVMHWRQAEGVQSATPHYDWDGRKVNAGWVTTFNEMAVVSENRLTPIPQDFPLDIAALYGCALTTAFGVINHDASLAIGESIVIFGVGGVGLPTVLGASLAGAYPIVAVDLFEDKLALAREYGATHTILASAGSDLDEALLEANEGRRYDVCIDNTGRSQVIESCYRISSPQARIVMVGVPRHDDPVRIDTLPLHFGKLLTGSHGGGCQPSRDIPRYMRLQRSGRFNLNKLISHRYRLEDINAAIGDLRSGRAMRCLIEFTNG